MSNPDEIVLFTRKEADAILKRKVTKDEWEHIKEWITTDDNMWEVIDECIRHTIEGVKLVRYIKETNG